MFNKVRRSLADFRLRLTMVNRAPEDLDDLPLPTAKRFWFYGPEWSWRSWTRRSSWFGRGSDEFANRTVYLCTPLGGVVVVTERHLSHLLDDPASHMNNAQWAAFQADMLAEVAQEDEAR